MDGAYNQRPDDEDLRRRRAGELLARAELFSGLDRLTLAKLAANLDTVSFRKGEAACNQGEPGDSLYLVSEGTFGVYVRGADDRPAVRVAELTRGGCFGEMALLTGEPRSATVLADGDGELLRLDHERFTELVRRDPNIGLALSASLSRRLGAASRSIKDSEQFIRDRIDKQIQLLSTSERTNVLRASVLEEASPECLSVLFGSDGPRVRALLAELGWHESRPPAAVVSTLRAAHARIAGGDAAAGYAREAIDKLCDALLWQDALAVAESYAPRADFVALFGRALRAGAEMSPDKIVHWLQRLSDDEAASDPVLAAGRDAMRQAQASAEVTPDISVRQRILNLGNRLRNRPGQIASVFLSAVFVAAAIFASTSSKPLAFVLLLAGAIVLWIVAIFPEFVVYLGLVVAWVFLGIAKPSEAVAGFGSTSWISIFAILAIGAALADSGLVFRLGLLLVRRLPKGLFAQGAAYLASGLLLTLLVPASAARTRLLLPTALAAAQSQRFKDRSPESAFLGLAAFIGAGPLLYTFLNGSSSNFLGLGLIPEAARARFDLAFWFIAAAPLAAFVSVGSLAALWFILRPGKTQQTSHAQVELQLSLLGRTTGHEIIMALILTALVVGWNVGPSFGVNPAIVGLASVVAAALAGCISRQSLNDLNWDFLVSFGVVLGLPPIMTALGIDAQITEAVRRAAGNASLHPAIF
ncbi:MAG TPA: cyclic nucleotide-binding domain-containing protein, partial [Pseudorhodoplanes sp.]|nr:cyclic nucleotide-binding domain-containing protein [Pseudorhodoplanes sp.]